MSAAGLEASLKLITHLHEHTTPWNVSALGRHLVGVCPLFHVSRSCLMFTWSAVINVRMVRDIMSLICRDSDPCATLVLENRASFQVRLRLLDPRPPLEDLHRSRHKGLRRSLFCLLQPQDEGTYMHMDMVNCFAWMLQWLMTALSLVHNTCLSSCRVNSSVITTSAPALVVQEVKATHGWTRDWSQRTRNDNTVLHHQLNAFRNSDTQVYFDANLENTDVYGIFQKLNH